jgi:hypothetical protein
MKSILDPSFRYTASFDTDLRYAFARILRDHRMDAQMAVQPPPDALANILSIARRTATRQR